MYADLEAAIAKDLHSIELIFYVSKCFDHCVFLLDLRRDKRCKKSCNDEEGYYCSILIYGAFFLVLNIVLRVCLEEILISSGAYSLEKLITMNPKSQY